MQNMAPEDLIYELKSVVIHRGGAYGGHYYAYVHDDLKQGNYYLDKQEEFDDAPIEIKGKAFEIKEYMNENQKKELDDEKNKNNPNYNPDGKNDDEKKGKKNKKNKKNNKKMNEEVTI